MRSESSVSKYEALTIRRLIVVVAALVLGLSGRAAPAGFIPVYGGPTYDSGSGSGFPSATVPRQQLGVNGAGTAVATAGRRVGNVLDSRPFRWDAGSTTPTELGNLGTNTFGFTDARAAGIDASGTVFGYANRYTASGAELGPRAVRWDPQGTAATELGHLGASSPSGYVAANVRGVSAGGTVVGSSSKYTGSTYLGIRAVRWDAGSTTPTELGHLGTDVRGRTEVAALAVNDAGTAVGYGIKFVPNLEPTNRAIRWEAGGTAATELGHLGTTSSGYTATYALALDTSGAAFGDVLKFVADASLGHRAVRWEANSTQTTELGNLGTKPSGYTEVNFRAVNAAGTAVGDAQKYVDHAYVGERAVRWDAGGTSATELGVLGVLSGELTSAVALSINAGGAIVGTVADYANNSFLGYRAVLWAVDGTAINLNTFIDPASGWTLTEADSISDTNFVAGVGLFDPDGAGPLQPYTRAFLMDVSSVVPEPAALSVFVGLPLLSRRKRR
jgi:hypothetical protein